MPAPACSEQKFIELVQQFGVTGTARTLGINARNVNSRRRKLEGKYGISLERNGAVFIPKYDPPDYATRYPIDIEDGMAVIFSDAHFWPGVISTAHRALLRFLKEYAPHIKLIVCNGDALDGASISRHSPLSWETRPTLVQEVEACTDRLGEIIEAAPKAKRVWTIGNHDARYEARLATMAPEYAKVHGVHLKDHFPLWENAMSAWINDDVVIKHRIRGGVHATHNNTVNAGKTTVTGHLHSLKVTPFTSYGEKHDSWPKTTFGVDTGTLADPFGPQFRYAEDGPINHRSGFAVLTFNKGQIAWPELVHVIDSGLVEFRGKFYEV